MYRIHDHRRLYEKHEWKYFTNECFPMKILSIKVLLKNWNCYVNSEREFFFKKSYLIEAHSYIGCDDEKGGKSL